mgnify:CR=1 FL=1
MKSQISLIAIALLLDSNAVTIKDLNKYNQLSQIKSKTLNRQDDAAVADDATAAADDSTCVNDDTVGDSYGDTCTDYYDAQPD